MRPFGLLQSYPATVSLALVLGLLIGGFPSHTREISMAALAFLMTLSLANVKMERYQGRKYVRGVAAAVALNYGLLSALILVLGSFFEERLWWGWVLMAAAPSAVAVIAFTTMLGGPTAKSLVYSAVVYVLALAVMPLVTLFFIGSAVSATDLFVTLLLVILLPMVLSRAVARMKIRKPASASMMNISFAVLVFAVAGSNRDAFLSEVDIVLLVSAVALIRTFGVGLLAEGVLRWRGMPAPERTVFVLFSSYKNLGLTATVAIALFEPIVAMPAAICIVFEVTWSIFLLWYYPKPQLDASLK